jgi:hypothetical protein
VKKRENCESWKGAAIQTALEPESRLIAIVGTVTRQLLVKTMQAGEDLACALAIFNMWKSVTAL